MITTVVSVSVAKPIMVSFGTNHGPIIAPTVSSSTANPLAPRSAPEVYEKIEDDVPNTFHYKAPTPHQYRKQILSHKPNPNLILGTPLDIKFTPALQKYDIYNRKSKFAKAIGLDYTGPQYFEVQQYEVDKIARQVENKSQSSSQHFVQQYTTQRRYDNQEPKVQNAQQVKQVVYQVHEPQNSVSSYQYNFNKNNNQYVPEIGVIYSSGLRYYVPQIVYYNQEENENSVYDKSEPKYYHHRPQ